MELDKYGKKALDWVMKGNSLFITGKAGTGKTTVLREITARCKRLRRNVVVLAPTGIAAKNARGVTIHSFFHLPLGLYLPGMRMRKLYALNEEEMSIVRNLDLIIIDEVSMVRCDLMDEIDDVLRHYRRDTRPFGGVQVVMFGDLYQLMPVVTDDDWEQLKTKYESAYFFNSYVLKRIDCPMFELRKVYRQNDNNFITLLNNVRLGKVSQAELRELAGRYRKNFVPGDNAGYIRLTTHNRRANSYNWKKMNDLSGQTYEYKAYIEDFFPKEEYPTDYCLQLKVGARVMFIRNDNNYGQFVNGTLGTVVSLRERSIEVRTDDGTIIDVERQTWDFYRYHINKKTKEIEPILCGSFKQYPLKLAWAMTIHKSQGLTFDKVIIDAGKAFTYGQVYVALSRCRRFHGIILVSPIKEEIIKTDPVVTEYMNSVRRITIDNEPVDDKSRHLLAITGPQRTLWMIRDGMTPQQVAKQTDQRIEIIYGHITKLIEEGELEAKDYVDEDVYDSVLSALGQYGLDADLKEIKTECCSGTKYADIRMVIADIKRQGLEEDYEIIDDETENEEVEEIEETDDSEWYFVDSVPFKKTSKRFLSYNCRVVLSPLGYYLEVTDEYIKLGDYPDGFSCDEGNVWIKKPSNKIDRRIVHEREEDYYLIGTIREEENLIVFTDPEGNVFRITFEDD